MDFAVTQCPSTNSPWPSSRSLRYSRRTHTFWLGILQIKWDILISIKAWETKIHEKKIFIKKVFRRLPRRDYKAACYSSAKFLNINPLHTAADFRNTYTSSSNVTMTSPSQVSPKLLCRPYRCSESPPSDTDWNPETVYYIVSIQLDPDRGSVSLYWRMALRETEPISS